MNNLFYDFIEKALDPAAISYYINATERYPQRGDATYVQIIHTDYFDKWYYKCGTGQVDKGDVDILIKQIKKDEEHEFSIYIHMAIATRNALLIASRVNAIYTARQHYMEFAIRPEHLTPDEVIVGIYGEKEERRQGLFHINLDEQGGHLNMSINHFRLNRRFRNRSPDPGN